MTNDDLLRVHNWLKAIAETCELSCLDICVFEGDVGLQLLAYRGMQMVTLRIPKIDMETAREDLPAVISEQILMKFERQKPEEK